MSARTQGWKQSYLLDHQLRRVVYYSGLVLGGLVVARIVIAISRHVAVLMPLGILAALFFSAFELALAVMASILVGIVILAIIGLPLSSLLRRLHVIR